VQEENPEAGMFPGWELKSGIWVSRWGGGGGWIVVRREGVSRPGGSKEARKDKTGAETGSSVLTDPTKRATCTRKRLRPDNNYTRFLSTLSREGNQEVLTEMDGPSRGNTGGGLNSHEGKGLDLSIPQCKPRPTSQYLRVKKNGRGCMP